MVGSHMIDVGIFHVENVQCGLCRFSEWDSYSLLLNLYCASTFQNIVSGNPCYLPTRMTLVTTIIFMIAHFVEINL